MHEPATVGIVGCGAVSHQYLPTLVASHRVAVTAVSDVDADAAARVGIQYDVPTLTPDQLMAHDGVDIVLNLTPMEFHEPITRTALAAGHHVYSEKMLAMTVAGARDLIALASANDLALAAAPDTLLGSSFEAARGQLEVGAIGTPLTAVAIMLRDRQPPPRYFIDHHALFDMAPYYVSALTSLFGPVASVLGTVDAETDVVRGERAELGYSALLRFTSGLSASLALTWRSHHAAEVTTLDVHGSEGVLRFANPNTFGDPAFVRRHEDAEGSWREVTGSRAPVSARSNLRGLGVIEMAEAIVEGRSPRASAVRAAHVVDVLRSIVTSAASGSDARLTTDVARTEPLGATDRARYLG